MLIVRVINRFSTKALVEVRVCVIGCLLTTYRSRVVKNERGERNFNRGSIVCTLFNMGLRVVSVRRMLFYHFVSSLRCRVLEPCISLNFDVFVRSRPIKALKLLGKKLNVGGSIGWS